MGSRARKKRKNRNPEDKARLPYSGKFKDLETRCFNVKVVWQHLYNCGMDPSIINVLYLVRVGDRVKIGRCCQLIARWANIVVQWPELRPVIVIAAIKNAQSYETLLHEIFSEHRVYSEWFNYTEEMERLKDIQTPEELAVWAITRHPIIEHDWSIKVRASGGMKNNQKEYPLEQVSRP